MKYFFEDMENNMEFNHERNMQKIRELVGSITLENSIVFEKDDVVGYQGVDSDMVAISKALMHNPLVAVSYVNMPKNYTYAPHIHDCVETICVFGGDVTFITENRGEITLGVGDVISLGPGERHSNTTINGCQMITITVPADAGYPDLNGE